MTNLQQATASMVRAVKITCDQHQAVWAASAPFTQFYSHLSAALIAMEAAVVAQQEATKGVSLDKARDRKALTASILSMSRLVESYAMAAGNAPLQRDAHLTPSMLQKAADDNVVGMANRIASLTETHLAVLVPYGITAADVTALRDEAAAYATVIGTPARTRDISKEGTKALAESIANMRRHLGMMDKLMGVYEASAPEFHTTYFITRRITDPVTRSRALEVQVVDEAGNPLPGALFSVKAAKLKRLTSEMGSCRAQNMSKGPHKAVVSKEGYATQTVDFTITPNERRMLRVVMTAW